MRPNWRTLSYPISLASVLLAACQSVSGPAESGGTGLDAFLARQPYDLERRVYILEGDLPYTRAEAEDYYWANIAKTDDTATARSALSINQANGGDDRIPDAQQRSLTYCVSTGFGNNHQKVVDALNAAAAEWEAAADVNFVYVSGYDGSCNAANNAVWFDIRPVSGQDYTASAFFPHEARSQRSLLIDSSAFNMAAPQTLKGVMIHELGHALGFRHEHIRPMNNYDCDEFYSEDGSYRSLTAYDSTSVMHYTTPCGQAAREYVLSARDRNAAACMYGPAVGMMARCDYNGTTYRAHVEGSGWLRWVLDGDGAGTAWDSKQMEAVQIKLENMPGVSICYKAHVANKGWLGEVCDGATAGTTGQGRRMEAVEIRLRNAPAGCSVNYQAHVRNKSWLSPVKDGATAGTTGETRRMEALRVWLTGCESATTGSWTPWLNRDDPSGNGDGEHLSIFQQNGQVCASPQAIECRRKSDKMPSQQTGEVVTCSPTAGGICLNSDQSDQACDDYEVRFFCR